MRRAERLFQLIQVMRASRRALTAQTLANRLGVSIRTVYRDIADLQHQAVPIRGAAGVGYVLDAGFDLPPLMLTRDELDAVVLGAQWVAVRAEPQLAQAAANVLAKLSEVVPTHLRDHVLGGAVVTGEESSSASPLAAVLRQHIHGHVSIRVRYRSLDGIESSRVLWPVTIAYFNRAQLLAAWCELRGAFRNFRIDHILEVQPSGDAIPVSRKALLQQWQQAQAAVATDVVGQGLSVGSDEGGDPL